MSTIVYPQKKTGRNATSTSLNEKSDIFEIIGRVLVLLTVIFLFIPELNPAGFTFGNKDYFPLATTVFNFSDKLHESLQPYIAASALITLRTGILLAFIGIIISAIAECAGIGNRKLRSIAYPAGVFGSIAALAGIIIIFGACKEICLQISADSGVNSVVSFSFAGIYVFLVLSGLMIINGVVRCITNILHIKRTDNEKPKSFGMQEKYRLFLMLLPVLFLAFIFLYLPVYAWRYSFFKLEAGNFALASGKFVGLRNLTELLRNSGETGNILRNTLVMSGLGIAVSWIPVLLSVLLFEIPFARLRRSVQFFTTVPFFVSWVLVSVAAFAVLSPDGFVNRLIGLITGYRSNTLYLQEGSNTWIKMLLINLWKTIGWSTVIYVAGINGIDSELREAACIDGASRWQCIWHVIMPGILPVYLTVLLISVSGILNNGMEQYYLFRNPNNRETIEVLDLYVFRKAIEETGASNTSNMPLAAVVSLLKSLIGIFLLLTVNRVSQTVRGEDIV